MTENSEFEVANARASEGTPSDVKGFAVPRGVLARLIDEVRTHKPRGPHAYDREHNRHNR